MKIVYWNSNKPDMVVENYVMEVCGSVGQKVLDSYPVINYYVDSGEDNRHKECASTHHHSKYFSK